MLVSKTAWLGHEPKEQANFQAKAGWCFLCCDRGLRWAGTPFPRESGWECIILIITHPPPFHERQDLHIPLVFILQPTMGGFIHSHRGLIMCQTIMSQSLASHVRKLAPLPAVLQYANGGKSYSLRTSSYGAGPDYCSEAKWMASMSFYGRGVWIRTVFHGKWTGNNEATSFVNQGKLWGVCWHPLEIFRFLKLQNLCELHASSLHAFVCAGPQNSSVGRNNEKMQWCLVGDRNEKHHKNLQPQVFFLWEIHSLAIDVSCFLWREHLLKTRKKTTTLNQYNLEETEK